MSKEFEDLMESLPTMAQDAQLRYVFTAGRALGRREVKGELAEEMETAARKCIVTQYEGLIKAAALLRAAAIEAILEEG